MITNHHEFENTPLWSDFIKEYNLTPAQASQFATYLTMVRESNELFNLTAITEPKEIIAHHFQDSLAISKSVDFKTVSMIADVGSGAGFPGIPLKIAFPHLRVNLIEVAHKKVGFLRDVIETLKLDNIEVIDLDWRTFLRKTDEPIDLFVSRASLHTDELIRMFRANCPYRTKHVAYWASKEWQPMKIEEPFLLREFDYTIKGKRRRIVFFADKKS